MPSLLAYDFSTEESKLKAVVTFHRIESNVKTVFDATGTLNIRGYSE